MRNNAVVWFVFRRAKDKLKQRRVTAFLTVGSRQYLPHTVRAASGRRLMQGDPAPVVPTVQGAAPLYQPPHPPPAARTSRGGDGGDGVSVALGEVHPAPERATWDGEHQNTAYASKLTLFTKHDLACFLNTLQSRENLNITYYVTTYSFN